MDTQPTVQTIQPQEENSSDDELHDSPGYSLRTSLRAGSLSDIGPGRSD